MKTCRVCKKQQPAAQFHRDKTKRDGHCSICKPCVSQRMRAYYAVNGDAIRNRSAQWYYANPERHAAQTKKWYVTNPEKGRAIKRKWQDANRERHNANTKRWAALNKDRRSRTAWRTANAARISAKNAAWRVTNKTRIAARNSLWKKRNSHLVAECARKRFAAKLKATPAWANKFFIREAYRLAALRTKITGTPWHVDHMVPLVSPLVCGLHVEHNLQVIPGVENVRKHNRSWPDMPGGEHAAQ